MIKYIYKVSLKVDINQNNCGFRKQYHQWKKLNCQKKLKNIQNLAWTLEVTRN